MQAIGVADLNSQAIEATLDDILFYIILNWNESGGYWTMGIRNSGYQTIVNNIYLAPNYPLLRQFKYSDLPPGELGVGSNRLRNGPIPRDGFVSGEYQFIYTTAQELRILNAL